MSKTGDVLFSIVGASIAGVTVFFIDRYFSQKAAVENAPSTPTPSTNANDLGVNSYVTGLQFQQSAPQPQVTATSAPSSSCGCGSSSQTGATTLVAPPTMSTAQQSILNSMNNLASLEANAGINYNRPITTLVQ